MDNKDRLSVSDTINLVFNRDAEIERVKMAVKKYNRTVGKDVKVSLGYRKAGEPASIGEGGGFSLIFSAKNRKDSKPLILKYSSENLIIYKQNKSEKFRETARTIIERERYITQLIKNDPELSNAFPGYKGVVCQDDMYLIIMDKFMPVKQHFKDGITLYGFMKFSLDLLNALKLLHARNIFHRDIKPNNIMVATDSSVATLIDFSNAKIGDNDDKRVSENRTAIMKPNLYFPQNRNWTYYTEDMDLYSLGVSLYEFIVAEMNEDKWYELVEDDPEIEFFYELKTRTVEGLLKTGEIAEVFPEEFLNVILKAVQREPECRYKSAGDMIKAIESLECYRSYANRNDCTTTRLTEIKEMGLLINESRDAILGIEVKFNTGKRIRFHKMEGEDQKHFMRRLRKQCYNRTGLDVAPTFVKENEKLFNVRMSCYLSSSKAAKIVVHECPKCSHSFDKFLSYHEKTECPKCGHIIKYLWDQETSFSVVEKESANVNLAGMDTTNPGKVEGETSVNSHHEHREPSLHYTHQKNGDGSKNEGVFERYDVVTFDEKEKVVVLESLIYDGLEYVYVNEILPDESDITDVYKVMVVHPEDGTMEKVTDKKLLFVLLPRFRILLEEDA